MAGYLADASDSVKLDTAIHAMKHIAEIVHQAYHPTGTWLDCPKDVCASTRSVLFDIGVIVKHL